eukprot:TRINITY_DN5889_c1_g2_i1.p1 TRINITY_DN5889_c1_g2~~TRINITY_DN5889_c1_g2_i1.p1  ORF type:complete len:704 (-),score=100.96 TRINITY_DN5889_c1_g2_i1:13-2124(-)
MSSESDIPEEKIVAVFQKWDTNGDGRISFQELSRVMSALNPSFNVEDLRPIFRVLDTSGDGGLNFKEFVKFIMDDTFASSFGGASLRESIKSDESLSEDDVATLHSLLDMARDKGGSRTTWNTIYDALRNKPILVNAKPGKRRFQLIHHAMWWNNMHAIQNLVLRCRTNLNLLTSDGLTCLELAKGLLSGETKGCGAKESYQEMVDLFTRYKERGCSVYDLACTPEAILTDAENRINIWMWEMGQGFEKEWVQFELKDQQILGEAEANGDSTASLEFGKNRYEINFSEQKQRNVDHPTRIRTLMAVNVLWEWNSGEGAGKTVVWKAYEPAQQILLEMSFTKRFALVELEMNGVDYVVDTVAMRQFPKTSEFKYRFVRRRGLPLARGKDMVTLSGDVEVDLREMPSHWIGKNLHLFPATETSRVMVDASDVIATTIQKWMNSTIETGHHPAHGRVPGGPAPTSYEVEKVEMIYNPNLWGRYRSFRAQMQQRRDEIQAHPGTEWLKGTPSDIKQMPTADGSWGLDATILEQYFWHGTGKSADGSMDIIEAIVSSDQGSVDKSFFEQTVSEGMVGRHSMHAMFGPGLYLADLSSKSNLYVPCPQCNGGSYFRPKCQCDPAVVEAGPAYRMILCRSVLGRVYVDTNFDTSRYQGKSDSPAALLGADSVMGETKKHPNCNHALSFREFVAYDDRAVYPEFIVHYRRRA